MSYDERDRRWKLFMEVHVEWFTKLNFIERDRIRHAFNEGWQQRKHIEMCVSVGIEPSTTSPQIGMKARACP